MPDKRNVDWFRDAKWGVFLHYLAEKYLDAQDLTAEKWNDCVNDFDVEKLASQLESVGAGYCFITVGQNSGYYCSPNGVYDSIVDAGISKCSRRDLVSDLSEALSQRGIKLLVYCPSGAPTKDAAAIEKLKWQWGFTSDWPDMSGGRTGRRLAEFQKMWSAVIREWSCRWGKKVSGWWIDGCYFADEMYRHEDEPNFKSFAEALKAGNSESIIAFNAGVKVPVVRSSDYDDYTAGEIARGLPVADENVPITRWVDGAQYHILSFLGETWGGHELRFSDELVAAYTNYVNNKEGVVTWDVPITMNGSIPEPFLKQLSAVNDSIS